MTRKTNINPNVFKFISYSIITVVLMVVVTIMTNNIMGFFINKTEEDYIENNKSILSGYTKTVSLTLESLISTLSYINNPMVFTKATPEEIVANLGQQKENSNSDIISVVYITLDGKAYTDTGNVKNLSEYDYYYKDKNDKRPFILGEATYSYNGTIPVFEISEPVHDPNGDIKGTLTALVPISALAKVFEHDKMSTSGRLSIQDQNQRFIYAPNSYNIMRLPRVNIDQNPALKDITTVDDSEYVYVPVKTYDSMSFDIIYKVIPNTPGWIISIYTPQEARLKLVSDSKKYIVFVIVLLAVAIILLSTTEIYLSNYLQRKQILTIQYDPLTGVSSRQHFESDANRWLKHFTNGVFIVINCDIRGFKFINQKYGEKKADELLVFYANILKKECNEHRGLIGRGFADHFFIMARFDSQEEALSLFLSHINKLNARIKDYEIPFFPIFGITFSNCRDKNTDTIQKLIGQTSFATSTIRNNVITNYAIYDSALVEKINEEIYFEENMEQALKNNEFFVVYQPKIDLKSDKIVGSEALVRWNSPKMGIIGPDKFIPLFEKNGFITKLDFYVYDQVFKFMQDCLDKGLPVCKVSLNMSRNHAKPEIFMYNFMKLFNQYKIPSELIEIEILERSVMDDSTLKEIVDMLHSSGFSVAMDDFGSGQSSLNMLSKIPVDMLKFDRTFLLSSVGSDGRMEEEAKSFIKTLVNLGRNLKKETLFEGVETQEQRDFLKSIDCDQVQGYFYAKPLQQQDYLEFIKKYS